MSKENESPIEGETPEVTPAEGEVVTLKKEDYDMYVKMKEAKDNLVAEIKDLREKKQLSEAQVEELKLKNEELSNLKPSPEGETPEVTPDKIAELIEKGLTERLSHKEGVDKALAKDEALRLFKESHKEFHEDNDEGGLKLAAFERKLSMFNTDSAKSVEDFVNIFEGASTLMGGSSKPEDNPSNPYANSPSQEGRSVPDKDPEEKNLTSLELKIIERSFDGDKEKYLEQKAKRPEFVENLLRHATNY